MDATVTAVTAPGYALDSAWHAERDRLDSLTHLYDAGTLEVVERLGITSGWHCLDVGAGTGSLAQQLADLVAPAGRVTALDLDTRFLDSLRSEHLCVE
ncbi:MAG TPA: SAM-dependent methyltransferase, partial [Solirubrobacteraceae bacterium]|nr:SAM-dependent methyltransferase [Solirubrobacteraceae bacterium]